MTTRLLEGMARVNAEHPWSHNDAYTPWVLRHARTVRRGGGTSALDVGCGTGRLLRRLSAVMADVTGIEQDGETASRARAGLAGIGSATVIEGSFEDLPLDRPRYDLVTFVAVLHHLPLAQALGAARSLLRPGGRLVVVGLARETSADLPWSLASTVLNPVIGAIRSPRRASAKPVDMTAPTAEPRETFAQIADTARAVLPGVRIRRSLFWRYIAVWVAPETPSSAPPGRGVARRALRGAAAPSRSRDR